MIEADDRALLQETVHSALAGADEDAATDEILAQLGWRDLLAEEPADAIDLVFDALGRTGRAATALDDVLAAALGAQPRADLAVLLPPFAAWDPPGRIDADGLRAEGLGTPRAAGAGELLVVCGAASEPWAVTVATKDAEVAAVGGIDPEAGLQRIRLAGAQESAASAARLPETAWHAAVAHGRRALAHQIGGAARTMLDLARSHALEREQFGRPIAKFQAVRHRLADTLVALEALEATLAAAREAPGPVTAALASAQAGRTLRTAATHCQQVLAGVGFTAEHSFHRFLKRALALEGIFGSTDEIVVSIGRELLAARRVPTLIEL